VALGLALPVKQMSTRIFPEGKAQPVRKADNLFAICEPTVSTELDRLSLTTQWISTAFCRDSFIFLLFIHSVICGLVVRVLGYRSGGPSSIPGTTRKKVVGLERGPLSLVNTTEELFDRKVVAPV
jgi:hypothetical protein